MNKTVYVIRDERIRQNAARAISNIGVSADDQVMQVVITKYVDSKTAEQRGWFHALCAILGDEIGMHAGDIKEIAKAKMFGWKQVSYGGVTLTMADGHSEKLGRKKYAELIDIIYQMAGEAGISLPPPDRFRRSNGT